MINYVVTGFLYYGGHNLLFPTFLNIKKYIFNIDL